jgi:LytR cell envelope-related transcriptional attenuator
VSHVVGSAASRMHRRNRRTAIILVVLVAVLAGAFYYAASYFNRPSTPAASSDCPTGDFTAALGELSPNQITVNVYNATTRSGLAAETAKEVKARGYVIGQVANDPKKKKIDGVGELRFGPNGKPGANVAVTLLEGVVPLQDTRSDAAVDLVLGNAYKALSPAPSATSSSASPC